MVRSGFRVDAIDDYDDSGENREYPGEDDLGLGEETETEDDDPDPDATDFQGLMQMRPEDTVDLLQLAGLQAGSFVRGSQVVVPTGPMRCRVCGCTDQVGCEGGCLWAAPNLCSRCVA